MPVCKILPGSGGFVAFPGGRIEMISLLDRTEGSGALSRFGTVRRWVPAGGDLAGRVGDAQAAAGLGIEHRRLARPAGEAGRGAITRVTSTGLPGSATGAPLLGLASSSSSPERR